MLGLVEEKYLHNMSTFQQQFNNKSYVTIDKL